MIAWSLDKSILFDAIEGLLARAVVNKVEIVWIDFYPLVGHVLDRRTWVKIRVRPTL